MSPPAALKIEIVSASAGSGKTYTLAERLREALTTKEVRPEAILATTFTVKAAAELKQRARAALLECGRTVEAQRLAAARIGTVNSVCGRLVSEFAFELGLSPRLRVMGESQADHALERSLTTVATGEEQRELEAVGQRLSASLDDMYEQVRRVVNLARSNRIDSDELVRSAERSIEGLLGLFGEPAGDGSVLDRSLLRALATFIDGVDREHDGTKKTGKAVAAARRAHYLLKAGSPLPWSQWAMLENLDAAKKSADLAAGVIEAAAAVDRHPRLREDLRAAIRLVVGIAARGLQAYDSYKTDHGLLDFADQEVIALKLLDQPAVRDQLGGELELVLVDEFQDTSPIQLALFLKLAELAKESIWVGDQKQAIYGFRGTDPALMDAAIGQILGSEEPETLAFSWRSRPELVEVTSDLFARAFSSQAIPSGRVRLGAKRERDVELGPALERWRLWSKNKKNDASALAVCVKELLDDTEARVYDRDTEASRPIEPADVAVLCRTNATAKLVSGALEGLHIKAVVPRSGLLSTPEGRLTLAGLRLWVDPRDRLAAAEISRLLDLEGDPDRWLAEILLQTPGEKSRQWSPVVALMEARESGGEAGPIPVLAAVVEALEIREVCLRWGRAAERLANLDALFARAVQYVDSSALSAQGCSTAGLLHELALLASDENDEQATLSPRNAVVVSTWHGAKGLEWPVTVLFELERGLRVSPLGVSVVGEGHQIDLADPLANRWIRYWPDPFGRSGGKTAFRQRLDGHEAMAAARATSEREALRLLYVGWTRARDRLVLASRPGKLADGFIGQLSEDGVALLEEPDDRGNARWGGTDVRVLLREAEPAPPLPRVVTVESGYVRPPSTRHPPAFASPSALEGEGEVGEIVRIGGRTELVGAPDERRLGEVVHRFLAADRRALSREERVSLAQRLLDRWDLGSALSPAALMAASDRLGATLDERWPAALVRREWPLRRRTGSGTVVRGTTDLLLETAAGVVLIDHKSFPGRRPDAIEKAKGFGGQLDAYAHAAAAALGRPVIGRWIHFPLIGLLVEVRPPE